jgi:small-conductance mechanosensitive channel
MKAISFILLIGLLCSPLTYAEDTVTPQIEKLQQQLEPLTDSAPDKLRRQLISQVIALLQSQQQLTQQISALQTEIDNQPATLRAINQVIQQGENLPPLSATDAADKEQLDHLITTTNARLVELERAQTQQRKEQSEAELRQPVLREQITQLKQELDSTAGPEPAPQPVDNPQIRRELQNVQFQERSLRVQAMELELLALPKRAEIARLTWQKLEAERNLLTEHLNQMQEISKAQQRSEAERALQKLSEQLPRESTHPLLLTASDENRLLSGQLREALTQIEQTEQQRLARQQHLATLNSSFRAIAQQLELGAGHISPEQRRFIFKNREPISTHSTESEINTLRLQNTLLEQQRLEVSRQREQLPVSIAADLKADEQTLYRKLLADRLVLINRLHDSRQQLLSSLNQLLGLKTQINQQIKENSTLLSRQLLWNPVSEPIGINWPGEVFKSSLLAVEHFMEMRTQPLLEAQSGALLRGIIYIIILAPLLWLSGYYRRNRVIWHQLIGNVVHDQFHHSVQALLVPVLLALPLPLALLLASRVALNPAHPEAGVWQTLILAAALSSWTILTLRSWLRPVSGLFQAHFGLSEKLVQVLRKRLGLLFLIGLPLLLAEIYLWNIDAESVLSGISRLVMIALIAVFTLLWASLWPVRDQLNQLTDSFSWWSRAELWLALLVGFNLAMIGLTAAGYTFTVNVLIYAVLQTLLVLLATIVFYKLGMRWVLIAERRLEFDRAKTRRAEILAAREKQEEEPPLETNYLNLQTISEHSRTLLKTATVLLMVARRWGFLGGFLPFFSALDNLELWHSLNEAGDVVSRVTLKNILFGIAVISLSLLAAYNLPGLLELLLLRKLDLSPGTGYAVSMLLKYTLIIIGVLGAFGQFGLEWGKLQWLVAALGVGLGFGLQEIVANFVSGLIILFEKPVRIGDTVTIDNLTGTVTRIQIRATTIVDWDRKEVIIPNKTFITQQLINWSLTDSVTRIVIKVGVAYGSDTELARRLLLEAANEDPKVLSDPKPDCYFTLFGDSALQMELRLHVNAMSDRMEVTHRVNTRIDEKFKSAGLEIAFPQLDVHLHQASKTT